MPAIGPSRPGRFGSAWGAFLASIVVLVGLVALLSGDPTRWFRSASRAAPLVVYCAAGIKGPVEVAARDYEQLTGVRVQLQYGGSQTLLANLEVARRGDLYLPADDSYVDLARDKKLLAETIPLATMKPVLAVRGGNPRGIRSLDDLLAKKAKLAHANPEAAAVGKLATEALKAAKKWPAYQGLVVVFKPTVNDVAGDIALGAVDAGIVWDATVQQVQGLEVVHVPALEKARALMSICVLQSSEQPTEALRFARYLAARDAGLLSFADAGFSPVEGDDWKETPEVRLYAGAMLQSAVRDTLAAFATREGVEINTIYNGCGILVAQMEAQRKGSKKGPDAYFACDQEFMTKVHDLFEAPVTVSRNQLVILVHKGNPKKVRRLTDLGKPGLKVGIGHEKQCALGVITQETLRQSRTRDAVMKNVTVQLPAGDMLVNQMLAGSLDAAVAYISNAAGHADKLEACPINIPCAFAEQPFAIARGTRHKHLLGRLRDAILSAESKQLFEDNGFTWKAGAR